MGELEPQDVRSGVRVGALMAVGATFLFVLYPAPLPIVVLGLIMGSLSALLAMGLVLIYRANRIVNFAQGDLGGLAAVLAASLVVGPGVPFFLAVGIGLVAALVIGGITEIVFIRRFAKAPRLALTVATIGLAQLFQFSQLGLPRLFDYDTTPQPPRPFEFSFEWFPVVFGPGHLIILLTVPLVAAGLSLFFRRSRIGIAVRATAESADRAALLGIPTKRVNTIVWVLAAGLSALAVLLRLPIQGVSLGGVFSPSLLLLGLAAALIGRMESLPRTFAASLALGVLNEIVFFESGTTVVVDGVLFAIILAALLLQKGGVGERARDTGISTWSATREVRPIPSGLARLPEVRGVLVGGSVIALLALVILPLGWTQASVSRASLALLFFMIAASLVILTGWAGQISLGPLAVAAIGAAVAGTMAQQGRAFVVALVVAGVVGAAVSVLIGLPALRVQGLFYAVTSLGFAVATGTFILNEEYFGWLVPGPERVRRPVVLDKFDLESEWVLYFVCLLVAGLTAAVLWRLRTSRTGRALVANRDNTRAAQSFSISPARAQLTAFAMAGAIAAVAGALWMYHQRELPRSLLLPSNSLKVFSVAVIGGLTSVPGAILAAGYLAVVEFSPLSREPLTQLLTSGIGVMVILLFLPAGLGGGLTQLRDNLLRRVAAARHLVVPSLLADARVLEADETAATYRVTREPVDPLLTVQGLEVAYGRTQVLFGVDLHVERGEILALLGTNGAGKSTLLSAIAGLVPPRSGTVTFDGTDITGAEPVATVDRGIVLMPGGKGVFPTLTVEENLRLAAWPFENDPAYVRQATEEVLDIFPRLRERWDQKAGNLSGGEQQMLTLGQAYLAKPTLLMIDELSLGLAPVIVEQLLGIVAQIHARGTTIVVVEQSVNVAVTLSQRAIFMEKGEVRYDGPTAELAEHPDILRAVFLAAAEPTAAPTNGHRPFVGHCAECGHEAPVVLELDDVAISFGGIAAVRGVDFAVREGEILGIIGANGAGKTTVFDLVSGFLSPDRGRIRLHGTDVTDLSSPGRAALGLGRSFQDARLFPAMTVRQTIATALERHVEVRDPLAAFVLSPAVKISERAVAERVEELIELMHLEAFADKFVGELSTGTRRIVDLACTLAHGPSVLLLDEPSSGIAQRESEALGPVLLDIRRQTGAAIVVIEHDMPLITSISDRMIALEVGAVIAEGSPGEVVHDPRVIAGYLGSGDAAIHRSGAPATRSRPGGGEASEPGTATGGGRPRRRAPLVAGDRR